MKAEDRELITEWMRHLEFHDQDDDGIGEMFVSFKIRDEESETRRIFSSMSLDDAKEIMEHYVGELAHPCDDFADDWYEEDSGFGVSFGWDDDRNEIYIDANFRT